MEEVYKDVLDYEGFYQVSNLGNVKSLERKVPFKNSFKKLKERILKPSKDGRGYYKVSLAKNGINKTKLVHQLVAVAFLNHKPDGYKIVVDHIDSNPLNNNLKNLQLISQRENLSKDKKGYSSKYTGVCWNKKSNKWVATIRINGKIKHLGLFHNEIDAANAYQAVLKELIK
jgi:hypothetical protein